MSFRILCIEPSPVARVGIEAIFESHHRTPPKLAGDTQQALEILHDEHIDVVITDVKVDGRTAFEFAQELKSTAPDLKFVLWAHLSSHSLIAQAIVHQFYEVIPRHASIAKFVEAVEAIRAGRKPGWSLCHRFSQFMHRTDWPTMDVTADKLNGSLVQSVSPPIATIASTKKLSLAPKKSRTKGTDVSTLKRSEKQKDAPKLTTAVELTKREMQMMGLLALGLNNQDISNVLGIRLDTTKEHVQNILRKLRLPDRTAIAIWALRHARVELGLPSMELES